MDRVARVLTIVMVAFAGVVGTFGRIGLFGDGAHFLLNMRLSDSFYFGNQNRVLVAGVTQLPALAAMRLSVLDGDSLAIVYSAGVAGIPAIIWALALWIQRRDSLFWIFALMWACVYPVTGFFAVGEYNLTYALVALAMSVTARPGRMSAGESVCLVVISALLLRSYESMVFLGPIVASALVVRLRQSWNISATSRSGLVLTRTSAITAIVLILLGSIGAVLATFSTLAPSAGGTVDTATSLPSLARDPRVVLSSVCAVCFVVAAAVRTRALGILLVAVATGSAVLVVLAPVIPGAIDSIDAKWPYPWMYYQARIAAGVMLAMLLVVVIVVRFIRTDAVDRLKGSLARAWVIPTLLVLAMTIDFTRSCLEFRNWTDEFTQVVRTQRVPISLELSGIDPRYAWQWTNPTLSVLFWSETGQGVVLNAQNYRGWQPFDPTSDAQGLGEQILGRN